MLINTDVQEAAYPALTIDNYSAAVAMVEHLVQAGHRRIAFIGGPEGNFDARERLRGYRDALARLAPEAPPQEFAGDFSETAGYEAGKRIAQAADRPQAVFAANDMMALGCLYAFNEAGVRVPQDIALAGFDDIPLARFVHPTLTTMRVSIAELGGRAMSRLLDTIDSDGERVAPSAMLVPELIVRESSIGAAPRAKT